MDRSGIILHRKKNSVNSNLFTGENVTNIISMLELEHSAIDIEQCFSHFLVLKTLDIFKNYRGPQELLFIWIIAIDI